MTHIPSRVISVRHYHYWLIHYWSAWTANHQGKKSLHAITPSAQWFCLVIQLASVFWCSSVTDMNRGWVTIRLSFELLINMYGVSFNRFDLAVAKWLAIKVSAKLWLKLADARIGLLCRLLCRRLTYWYSLWIHNRLTNSQIILTEIAITAILIRSMIRHGDSWHSL